MPPALLVVHATAEYVLVGHFQADELGRGAGHGPGVTLEREDRDERAARALARAVAAELAECLSLVEDIVDEDDGARSQGLTRTLHPAQLTANRATQVTREVAVVH